jgi:hypothetical protein
MCWMLVLDFYFNGNLSTFIQNRKGLTEPEIRYFGRQLLQLI